MLSPCGVVMRGRRTPRHGHGARRRVPVLVHDCGDEVGHLLVPGLNPWPFVDEQLLPIGRALEDEEQTPRNSRRNLLPMKGINRSLLMGHEHVARALIELMQSRKTSSGTDHVFHHAPEAFDRIEVVPTMGR